jgi:Sec-independent protein translocase protein TatA
MTNRDDRDLRALVEDLDETLTTLRSELDEDGQQREGRPRPPTVGELVRFTEEYTIPTTIAVLEAAVAALELLRGLLGLVSPNGREERQVGGASDAALRGVERTFSELRRALREVDLSADRETSDVVTEARELTSAVEQRLAEERSGREEADETQAKQGVAIDVDEATVDVESELRSIREDLDDQDAN